MNKLLRIVDVNINRSQEGLRVCEDIVRFIINDKRLTRSFKTLRQAVGREAKGISEAGSALLKSRNVKRDIGKKTTERERRRRNVKDVFRANIQRAKESLRVLEEIAKLFDVKASQRFKKFRFRTYELEKKSCLKLEALLHN